MTDDAVPKTADELLAAREAEPLDEHPDPAVAELQKCKPAAHLRVIVEGGTTGALTAERIPVLACRNPAEGPPPPTWGALLDTGGRAQGMQLYPDAVVMLAHQLPIVADAARSAGSGATVSIQHTVQKKFATWRSVTPDVADVVASQLAAMHA